MLPTRKSASRFVLSCAASNRSQRSSTPSPASDAARISFSAAPELPAKPTQTLGRRRTSFALRVRGRALPIDYQDRQHPNVGRHLTELPRDPGWISLVSRWPHALGVREGSLIREDVVTLLGGRRLAFAEWGDPDGAPVFFFHGGPGSRLQRPDEAITASRRVRLVTVDRPGYGGSDPRPGRRLVDWPDDVRAVADALDIENFAVVGWSDGGGHALACAAKLAPRVTAAIDVSGRGPIRDVPGALEDKSEEERSLVELYQQEPERALAETEAWMAREMAWLEQPEMIFEPARMARRPEADRNYLADSSAQEAAAQGLREAYRQGPIGVLSDWVALFAEDWGFALDEINALVHVWQGDQDTVPRSHPEYLRERLRKADVRYWPDTGHWGVFAHWSDVLDVVATA